MRRFRRFEVQAGSRRERAGGRGATAGRRPGSLPPCPRRPVVAHRRYRRLAEHGLRGCRALGRPGHGLLRAGSGRRDAPVMARRPPRPGDPLRERHSVAAGVRSPRRGLGRALGAHRLATEHVGSTAVAGLVAKPIVDIAVRVGRTVSAAEIVDALVGAGYVFRGDQGEHGGLLFVAEGQALERLLRLLGTDLRLSVGHQSRSVIVVARHNECAGWEFVPERCRPCRHQEVGAARHRCSLRRARRRCQRAMHVRQAHRGSLAVTLLRTSFRAQYMIARACSLRGQIPAPERERPLISRGLSRRVRRILTEYWHHSATRLRWMKMHPGSPIVRSTCPWDRRVQLARGRAAIPATGGSAACPRKHRSAHS